uniref:Secreted protein n=1 Tax=Steinernema glaseri TaxID=37863 RepID=A0A1I7YXA9_9BILA
MGTSCCAQCVTLYNVTFNVVTNVAAAGCKLCSVMEETSERSFRRHSIAMSFAMHFARKRRHEKSSIT